MINSFGHYVHFGHPKGSFVPGISSMPETLPETSIPETLHTLPPWPCYFDTNVLQVP